MTDLKTLREACFDHTARAMTAYPVHDQMIIQSITMIDELVKVANRLSMRLRDWVSWPVPEARKDIDDTRRLAELISVESENSLRESIRQRRSDLPPSFGTPLTEDEWKMIAESAGVIKHIFSKRDELEVELEVLMRKHMPNVQTVAGTLVGAKLLSQAGSLKRLASMPSSTVQLLGAEKALFRHLKSGARPPKHGIILQHPIVQEADRKLRGKAARMLADKISMAARIDYFKGDFAGDRLLKDLEGKL